MAVPGGFLEDRAWVLWNFSPIFGHLTLFRWSKFEILTLVIYHTPLIFVEYDKKLWGSNCMHNELAYYEKRSSIFSIIFVPLRLTKLSVLSWRKKDWISLKSILRCNVHPESYVHNINSDNFLPFFENLLDLPVSAELGCFCSHCWN